ncbi:NUDIX domain-containing protein [Corynebacterium sp. 153RC1]|uniref:NUDIX domain-containing protein n=1 Tax=unclassified Corynebacterium TaxID=2624378 RepID=UPI00211CD1E7|nr:MULTISPECIES: NUDIX domain-containing protein [unclassified Corynebacterium]MCQ9352520.1 NUDIX domain-containing protein [Corynebacterium sp. 209RC1]MCQ9354704.1 NUDIX domain-containing protein [Corynebacterium sp. 1222RC1]MCQ9356815.1 NUDIX domain-containing protein [Corynebacterium sp. 122RC1]MCQ9358981.1 NUDIX domain-containing protein [Corynebacterium sp. 142RC1]MCQ9361283.1 NUDIX domain-containing protein [Corynebacterium sp. 153RC1]
MNWVVGPDGKKRWGKYGAAGLLLVADGHVLLQHRAAWTADGGTWALPGGALEFGETAVEAACREAYEEAQVRDFRVVGERVTAVHGSWTYTTVIAVADHLLETVANEESLELKWVAVEDVASYPLLEAFAKAWPELQRLVAPTTPGQSPEA